MSRLVIASLLLTLSIRGQDAPPEPAFKDRAKLILKDILNQKWASSWQEATLQKIRLVAQKADLAQPTGLSPVWHAEIAGPDGKTGYLMWDPSGEGRLVEFALDDQLPIEGAIAGLPTLQQFPVKDSEGRAIASGCVPTSAASVMLHWMARQKVDAPSAQEMTVALRKRLRMIRFPDTDGFTENGMALAGALPVKMAAALNVESQERGLSLAAQLSPFSMARFRDEITSGRPTLLSCTVRVPHKPQLSWGHAVVGIAAARIDDVELVGIHDNFFPTRHPGTIRWIRQDAFRTLTMIRPPEK